MRRRECAAVPSSLISAKVLESEILLIAVDAPRENQILLYTLLPPSNTRSVVEVFVIFIVDVPLSTIHTLVAFRAPVEKTRPPEAPIPFNVTKLLPNISVFVPSAPFAM